jgi:hypothetical protein
VAGSPDLALSGTWTPAAADTQVSIDGGAFANSTNVPTYTNGRWRLILTAAELTGKAILVRVVDSATKVVDDELIEVFTFGHASAFYPDLYSSTLLGTNGSALSAVPWNATWDAEVQSEVQDAIEVNHLDHLLAVTYDPASEPGVADALLNELVENDGGVARFTANSLEQAPTGGGASAAVIADAVWDELRSEHVGAGSFGEGVALSSGERSTLAAAILDLANGIESGVTPRQAFRAMGAILAGIVSGGGTATEVFKGLGQAAGGTTRVTVTAEADGDRPAVTLNL